MIYALFLCLMASASASLMAKLTPLSSRVDFGHNSWEVDWHVVNVGEEPVSFLPWYTPVDTIWEDIFRVEDEQGNVVPYTGKVARYAPITDASYVTIMPGESMRSQVDLTRSYLLDADGAYRISLRQLVHNDAPTYVEHNVIAMAFHSTHLQMARFNQTDGLVGMSFQNCDSTQTSQTQAAHNTALFTQSANAVSCTSSSSGPASRCSSTYTTWFGATSSSQYTTVRTCWRNIQRDLPSANFYCCPSGCGRNCGTGIYAYVFPSDRTMTQHLCQAFWDIPSERPETLTHEQSHFTVTCGTDDITYGRSSCMNLARSSPSSAIRNADNHCFFGADVRV